MREKFSNDCIYRPNNGSIEPVASPSSENKFFTSLGMQEFIDENGYPRVSEDSDHVYAKCTIHEGETRYFIKSTRYAKLYDPSGMYTEGHHKRFNKMIGANEFRFKRVNPRIFELYTNFLKTKNIAWLNNAERELV